MAAFLSAFPLTMVTLAYSPIDSHVSWCYKPITMVIEKGIGRWKQTVLEWLEKEDRSQSWLSRKAGLNPNYLSALLNDIRRPGVKALNKLEAAMQLEARTLVSLRNAEALMTQAESETEEVPYGHKA